MPHESAHLRRATTARRARTLGALVFAVVAAGLSTKADVPLPTLTMASAVHGMMNSEGTRKYPVHLHDAGVLYCNTDIGNLFVHDSSGNVYVDMRGQRPRLRAGDRLEITGVSASASARHCSMAALSGSVRRASRDSRSVSVILHSTVECCCAATVNAQRSSDTTSVRVLLAIFILT